MSPELIDNDLTLIRKAKVSLTYNKPAYVEISILVFKKY